jgi:glycosyltransferase involved in cell wall biosynthesis
LNTEYVHKQSLLNDKDLPRNWPLRTEEQILACWKGEVAKPAVSICCPTFNHVAWIVDALHSFLSQETDFPIEIIVRDDASTDGTSAIVMEYAAQYPNIIRPVILATNRFNEGVRAIHDWPKLARGKYIALCEEG